jgi:ubiquinone/menaquinone biosynthesis C-methylase UbiE
LRGQEYNGWYWDKFIGERITGSAVNHFQNIYSYQAAEYHRMIAAEDVDGNLLPALRQVASLEGKRILDLGSGTGRIPLLLREIPCQITSLELSRPMLQEQRTQREQGGGAWNLLQGDLRNLPFHSGMFDLVLAGWAIGHFAGWYPKNWQDEIGRGLWEMLRTAAPGGAVIILETMTTGSLTPAPPNEGLAEYYRWLENSWGFHCEVIRTDYDFANVETAAAYTEFFFGPVLAADIRKNGWARVPEWTGVWSRKV